mgnify:CR=1 FL=1
MATKKATKKVTKAAEVKVETPVVEVEEVKAETPVVEAPVVEVKEEVKAEVKEEVKKAPAKKTPAKKAATTEKKAPVKKAAAKVESVITLEFGEYTAVMADVENKVKAQFVADGNKEADIKSLNIYVKPFENSAYYVINGDVTGRVDLF